MTSAPESGEGGKVGGSGGSVGGSAGAGGTAGAGAGDSGGPGVGGSAVTLESHASATSGSVSGSSVLVVRNLDRSSVLGDRVEVGASLWAKFRGLMGRPALAPGGGLWLPDSNGIHMMFMRFRIDAVFLGRPDADGARAVVAVRRSLPTWRGLVPFVRRAHGVVELPIGAIDASGTQVGDRVSFEPADV